jgi:hypothetical protein
VFSDGYALFVRLIAFQYVEENLVRIKYLRILYARQNHNTGRVDFFARVKKLSSESSPLCQIP